MFNLDNREFPIEGIPLKGESSGDFFQLAPTDIVTSVSPVSFDARAYMIEDELTLEGDFSADFELECSRCLEKFLFSVKLLGHNLTENLENPSEADLTQALREDILLALPVYPHCEEGENPRECPAMGKFDASNKAHPEPETEATNAELPNPWAALDKIDGLDTKSD